MTELNLSLEAVLTGRGFMDVPASPLQLAVVRAAYGLPLGDVIDAEARARHFGCDMAETCRPRRVVLICGVRGGKSTLGVAHAIASCLIADLRTLKAHELPRYAIVGPTVDAADATYKQLVGYLQSSLVLRAFVEGDPTSNTVIIKRADGRRVEIVVVAAHRGGLSVRNRWLVGITLEEVASFSSESSGAVVNAEEILRAAETRLLPGCQAWLISSPFGPVGLLYELFQKHYGKPGATLVVHAPTRALNPSFPQSRIDEIARDDPDVAAREYGAEWVDADSAYLPAVLVDAALRNGPLIRAGRGYAAGMDPATRGNDWTLAIAWPERKAVGEQLVTEVVVAGVWRWQGSKQSPLSPRAVLAEVAQLLRGYGIAHAYVDAWSFDALADHARGMGIDLQQHTGDRDLPYARLRTLLASGLIELPPDPLMRKDLLAIRQRATSGALKIQLPRSADGRHSDFAPAVALAAHYAELGGACGLWDVEGIERVIRAFARA